MMPLVTSADMQQIAAEAAVWVQSTRITVTTWQGKKVSLPSYKVQVDSGKSRIITVSRVAGDPPDSGPEFGVWQAEAAKTVAAVIVHWMQDRASRFGLADLESWRGLGPIDRQSVVEGKSGSVR